MSTKQKEMIFLKKYGNAPNEEIKGEIKNLTQSKLNLVADVHLIHKG